MAKKKILVVEDEDDVRILMAKFLAQAGYEVFSAANGEEGLKYAQAEMPDLIITDVIMPKKDGNQLFKEVHLTDWGHDIPFIVLTARGKMRDYFEVIEVDLFLEKPCPPSELMKKIEESLAKAEKVAIRKKEEAQRKIESEKAQPENLKSDAESFAQGGLHMGDSPLPGSKRAGKKWDTAKPKLLLIEPNLKFGEELCRWLIEYECCLVTSIKAFNDVLGFAADLIIMRKDAPGAEDETNLNRIQRKDNAGIVIYENIGELDSQQKLVFNEEGRKLVWHINALAQEIKNRR